MTKLTSLLAATSMMIIACSDSSDNSVISLTPLLERYVLSSEDSVPEGVAYDSQDRAFYATSLQGGSITRIAADGTESIFRVADNQVGLGGTKVDSARRRLWVCTLETESADNRVWVFDLDTAQLSMEFLLGALTTNGSCNDLALDAAGNAYVTDPANPYIYRLNPETGEGSILATDPLFTDITGLGLGLNGIALTEDESALIVGKFLPASLLRVSLPGGDTVEQISLTGATLPSPDGLSFLDGDLYTISNASVSRVRPNADFSAAEVLTTEQISGLSTSTTAESGLYVIKSEVTNFVLGMPLATPFEIFRVDLSTFE